MRKQLQMTWLYSFLWPNTTRKRVAITYVLTVSSMRDIPFVNNK